MQSKKVLIMSTRPQQPIPPEGERPGFGPQGPLSTTDIQTLNTGLDVIRALGRMEHAVEALERTTNSHGEKIQQIIRQTDRTEFTVGLLDREHVIQAERLKHLDRVVFVIEVIGIVLAGSGILLALARHLFHLPN
jgi:hypothetical protein